MVQGRAVHPPALATRASGRQAACQGSPSSVVPGTLRSKGRGGGPHGGVGRWVLPATTTANLLRAPWPRQRCPPPPALPHPCAHPLGRAPTPPLLPLAAGCRPPPLSERPLPPPQRPPAGCGRGSSCSGCKGGGHGGGRDCRLANWAAGGAAAVGVAGRERDRRASSGMRSSDARLLPPPPSVTTRATHLGVCTRPVPSTEGWMTGSSTLNDGLSCGKWGARLMRRAVALRSRSSRGRSKTDLQTQEEGRGERGGGNGGWPRGRWGAGRSTRRHGTAGQSWTSWPRRCTGLTGRG